MISSKSSNEGGDSNYCRPPKRKRTITSLACENCRSSHLKCDGNVMCSNCKRRNLKCTYSESKRRGRKPSILKKDHQAAQPIRDFHLSDAGVDSTVGNSDNLSDSGSEKMGYNDKYSVFPVQSNNLVETPVSTIAECQTIDEIKSNSIILYIGYLERLYPSLMNNCSEKATPAEMLEKLSTAVQVYNTYVNHLFPFINMPQQVIDIVHYICTPINTCPKQERIHYAGINATLAIGMYIHITI